MADQGTPRPIISVDGSVSAPLMQDFVDLLVEETVDGLYRCEVTFLNWSMAAGFTYFDRSLLDFGKAFKVEVGEDAAQTLFSGTIIGLEARYPQGAPPLIAVLAEDSLQNLRMTRRTRTFEQMTDAAVIQQIAGDYGLSAAVDMPGPQHKVLVQANQSDLAFIRERARANDAEVWVEDTTLHVQARGSRKAGDLTATYGDDLWEFQVLADLAGQRTSVTVGGWDVSAKQAISYEATSSAISSELGADTGGSSLLGSKLSERKEYLVHPVPFTDQEAQATAEAVYRRAARRFVTGAGTVEGNPALHVGTYLKLQGLGTLFTGTYYVTEVRHLFDLSLGYRTQFRVERPGIGGAGAGL